MSKPNYRVILTYDAERKIFHARAPELEHCSGEGASRAEAISRVEEEIDAQLANMLSHGTTPPRSVDEETFSGELAIKVSKGLHRDLAYQARSEGIEIDHLIGELLAAAMEGRKQTHRGVRSGNRQGQEHVPHDNIGNRHDGGGGPRRGGFGRGNNNYQLLDDRANFIEYVRGLEQGGGHQHARPQGQGGGPGGGDRRRRGRGGRGGGPDRGNFRQGGYQGQGGPQQHGGHPQHGQHGHGMNGNGGPARNGNAGAPMSASAPAPAAPSGGPESHGGSDDGDGNA